MTRPEESDNVDWSLGTFEGAEREQLRRWAKLPLSSILKALEEMADLSRQWGTLPDSLSVRESSEEGEWRKG